MNIKSITNKINEIVEEIRKLPDISEIASELKGFDSTEQLLFFKAIRNLYVSTMDSNDFIRGVDEMMWQFDENNVERPEGFDLIDMGLAWLKITENGTRDGIEAPALSFFDIRRAVFDEFGIDKSNCGNDSMIGNP